MPWYNPFSWFRHQQTDSEPRTFVGDTPRFSRRAVDSCADPMEGIFSMRISHDLRILGGRKARMMGLSLSEYMRFLLAQAVDDDDPNERAAIEDFSKVRSREP